MVRTGRASTATITWPGCRRPAAGPAGCDRRHLGARRRRGVGARDPEPAVHHPVLEREVVGHPDHQLGGEEGGRGTAGAGGRGRRGSRPRRPARVQAAGPRRRAAGGRGRRGDGGHAVGRTARRWWCRHRSPRRGCSAARARVPPAGTKLSVRSGEPPLRPVSSAKGATGTSSGTLTSATSEAVSVATTLAGSSLPSGADHDDAPDAAEEVGRGGDEPALGHGDADRARPCRARWSPAARPWSGRRPGPPPAPRSAARPGWSAARWRPVSPVALRSGRCEAGESSTTTQATAATTAATPTRTMTALR